MDEIFDLKVRNQWLRRRIITLLRQIIRTMFGDIVNRRIVEYVSLLTSPARVAGYLKLFKYVNLHFATWNQLVIICYLTNHANIVGIVSGRMESKPRRNHRGTLK